jgi:hypothetical protein
LINAQAVTVLPGSKQLAGDGADRADVGIADVQALLNRCLGREAGAMEPIISVVTDGLRARADSQ